MIRIAHISDSHFDERHRLQDCIDVHAAFVEQVVAQHVDLVVHSGDIFERKSTPAERIAVANLLQGLADIVPVVLVRGNHDALGEIQIFGRMKSRCGVTVFEGPSAQPYSSPVISTEHGDVGIVALPWFDKSHLVAQMDVDAADQETTRNRTIQAAEQLLIALRAEATRLRKESVVPILVGHVMVAGSETSTGQTLQGTTVELSPADIRDIGCEYAALGHIHKAQHWHDGAVCYAGSPQRQNFGETEPKGWRLVVIDDDGQLVESEFMPLPAREIVLLEVDYTRGERLTREMLDQELPQNAGALVRLRYRISPEELHLVNEDQLAEELRRYGASEVKLEAVLVHETRVRSEEISAAESTWEKVQAYLRAKSIDLPGEQLARLQEKLASLEAPHREEVSDEAA